MESQLHELAEARWFLSKVQDDFRGGKINVEITHKLLEKLDFPCHFAHVKHIFKENDRQNQGRITIEEFRAIYRCIVHREEITEIFNTYTENRKILSENSLIEFLTQEQYEMEIDHSDSVEIINKYEPIEEVKGERQMSIEGFARYMFSSECLLFKENCKTVYQDMNHPLSDYFISSSHNTYLISDQILGPSDIWGYVSALVKGCRCLEIDCWDGSQNEPIVYHGYTFTSKLLFKTVVQAINKYAFVTSDYPVVLSLENHCSPGQQEVMASILQSTFGDFLLSDMLEEFPDTLPSPEALKFKILVKNRKVGTLSETHERIGTDKSGQVLEWKEVIYEDGDEDSGMDPETWDVFLSRIKEEREADPSTLSGIAGVKKRKRKMKIAMALSDLVIYTKAEKFRNFQYSRVYQQFNETNSIGESRARKLSKLRVHEFIFHTAAFITRVYPKMMRADSSNFNPQEFWNVGCQMVALNFQTPGLPMDLQNGKFLDNGGSGYILKPDILRDTTLGFNPNEPEYDDHPVTLTIRIISGIQLPVSSSSNTPDIVVIIEVYGVPNDHVKQQTRVVKNNAFSPKWNETFTFLIQVPELALIRFVVETQQGLLSGNELLGQYTLPVLCMNKGYRRVPLFSKSGANLEPSSLFIYVWYFRE
ncbi:1-phosphatidylinositol 4,5-bisphosphate phosphodiesterase zeta-1 [Mus musculus]|uniref:1-phosphatidylinositol 4,5-bisphosphate phosphodiesterase zeta-1 n=2 Tax=Mus musculus TaxID=10090 RepID=PLCZ1_MOUSE|nr:1-phosphatidylinositol 4,5-bisphosphate phosphodiesterase zeta-1 [Mus musculus]Q8K4D7.1 RecName: Full=1-phosphatidylinositol 4,5-bisphosphate phosphodiesterase zeta-1; AltName: Full=Phosphoinositide phospholipase C-zeta-1; AltName: Full=Phospholipase C-zeta-1; Short=PLC-zeta-1 [Mus musculus]AAM95914.1 PLC-zeta [Mus musculus]|eukprot:NP_473407.2 1-phosphatidylinositol 4,5-bisphosphate phosphodiesterase zeta-1 [Mus musculus]